MICLIFSIQYIERDVKDEKESMPIFMVVFLLDKKGATFSPDLKTDNEPNFFGLMSALLEDMIEIGSCVERIADEYPPYNVKFSWTLFCVTY